MDLKPKICRQIMVIYICIVYCHYKTLENSMGLDTHKYKTVA